MLLYKYNSKGDKAMINIQYFKNMDLYRVWQWHEHTNTITVKYMTLEEVLVLLSTKETV